ncbi:hypothetical protein WOLCODRAFT_158730 [Wolfiporia cocos MD-104 SS10]|uniref:Uncharacterized protein n=1 Tax=Wolfiporia cocos (strain MD-104) TaxID=742152 RepID=A0A2H3JBA6_WOLCO|nr:hypothetical protein WOLCODRAFT_158730 [Wolfiporia cocos MD-104 SS10]
MGVTEDSIMRGSSGNPEPVVSLVSQHTENEHAREARSPNEHDMCGPSWEEELLSEIEALKAQLAKRQQKAASQAPIMTMATHLESPAHEMVRETLGEHSERPGRIHTFPDRGTMFEQNRMGRAKNGRQSELLRPVNQIEPGSYLGDAFHYVGYRAMGDQEGSSEASDISSSTEDSSDDEEAERQTENRHQSHKVPVLKPQEPTSYDGSVDVQAFHKFMREMSEYIRGYKLKVSRHASTISHFLTGTAYEFFVNTVSKNARRWDMKAVFIELFNYCFPVDFRMRMREKLRKSYQ